MPATAIITTISTRNPAGSWEVIEVIRESFDPDKTSPATGLTTYLSEQGSPAGDYRLAQVYNDSGFLVEDSIQGQWDGYSLAKN